MSQGLFRVRGIFSIAVGTWHGASRDKGICGVDCRRRNRGAVEGLVCGAMRRCPCGGDGSTRRDNRTACRVHIVVIASNCLTFCWKWARFRAALKRVKQAVLSLAIMLHAAGFWVIRLITRRANHALSLLRELRPWHGGPACRYSVEAGGDGGGREWTVAPRDRGAARLPRPAVGAHATVVAPLTLPLTRAPPSPRLRGARGLAVDSLAALSGRAYSAGAAAGSFWPKLGVSVRSTSASGPSLGRFSSQLMAPSMSFSHISRGSS